jgi:predicted branched-subunit amino acid permease
MITLTGRRREALAGARAMAPWLLGVTPFGLVIGVSAALADLPTLAGVLTGPLIYSGSAQVATIDLLDAGAAPLVVLLTALVINLRLVLYSAAMAPRWRGTPWWWRLAASYLLVDPSFAVGVDRYDRTGDRTGDLDQAQDRAGAHAYYLGGAVVLWAAWLAAITVGAVAGAGLPAGLHLEFVIPLFLLGEVVRKVHSRAMLRAALVAVAVALAALAAPLQLGVAAAIIAGLAAGAATRRTTPASHPAPVTEGATK